MFVAIFFVAASGPAADQEVVSSTQDGRTITFEPFVEFDAGYDSNLDGFVRNAVGSAFEKAEAGLRVRAQTETQTYSAFIKGRAYNYNELERQDRSDLEAALGWQGYLSDTQSLKLGTAFYRDHIALSHADLYDSFADYKFRNEDFTVRLKAKVHTEINTSDDEDLNNFNPDVFSITKNSAFDYHRPAATLNILTFKKFPVQPFAIGGVYHSYYFHEGPDPILTRTATGYFGIGGLRVKLGDNFRVDVGVRQNHRDMKDLVIGSANATFFDGRLKWTPTDAFKLTGYIERKYQESTSLFGVVDDVKYYGLTMDVRLADGLYLNVSGRIQEKDPLGDDLFYTKYVGKGSLSYRPTDKLEIFGTFLAKYVKEDFFVEDYDRYRGSVGVRLSF